MSGTNGAGQGTLDAVVGALFEGAMIPVRVAFGAATVFPQPDNAEVARTAILLENADRLARLHAPADAPEFDLPAALWSARVFQFACNRLVDKIESEVELPKEIAEAEPIGSTASEHWSVDLVFRSWWDLVRRSVSANAEDTLNATLLDVASRWPLAAVGTPAMPREDRMTIVLNHPCLRRVYIDRVDSRADREKQVAPWWSTDAV